MLTTDDVRQFDRDGFLILRRVIPAHLCDALRERAEALLDEFEPGDLKVIFSTKDQQHDRAKYFLESGDKIRFFFEEDVLAADGTLTRDKHLAVNKIGHALADLDPVFREFSTMPEIRSIVASLGKFQDPRIMQSMYIFKQPEIGGEVTCHQDSTFLDTEPSSLVGLWFALEDATLENGCLWAIPGAHKGGRRQTMTRLTDDATKFETHDPTAWDLSATVPLEVPKGSVILLHALAPHMSHKNTSARSRHAYTLHVCEGNYSWREGIWLKRSAALPTISLR